MLAGRSHRRHQLLRSRPAHVRYIRAGTKNNIIPDEAELGLTVRTYKAEVRKQVLVAIRRIADAEAQAAGAPRPPSIEHCESADAVYNDPALTARLRPALEAALGAGSVVTKEPITASEDFSVFVEQGIPGFYLSLGGADPQKYARRSQAASLCRRTTRRYSPPTSIRRCTRPSRWSSPCCAVCSSRRGRASPRRKCDVRSRQFCNCPSRACPTADRVSI